MHKVSNHNNDSRVLIPFTTGRYRISIKKPPIRLNTTSSTYLSLPTIGLSEVCVRIIDGSMKVQHEGAQVQNRRLYLRNGANC